MTDHEEVLRQAADWSAAGRKVALATVVSTWGSAPRPSGSQLAINDEDNSSAPFPGGCIEGAVVTEAQEVIREGKPRLLEFGVSNDDAWAVGLACGGRIRIFVERLG